MTRILLIDDDAKLRRTCANLLRSEGYEIFEAPDGKTGVGTALKERPDVIVCDVNMPGMNGHAVITALRAEEAMLRTPFIFLTGESEMSDLREGMNLGADDYLVKPIDPDQLLTAIRVRLKRAESNASIPQMAPASPDQLICLGLTPREAEVLFWVAQGKTNPEIAVITGVQLTTVKKHLESIFQKTGVENRTTAAALALEKLGPFE
ncbi:MAG TPA: response regulator transcription factor [Opitutaceae bacterium]|nr:response regulator transcription factor [Opitutaceae bacterium]